MTRIAHSSSMSRVRPLKPVSLPSCSCTALEVLAQRLAVGDDRCSAPRARRSGRRGCRGSTPPRVRVSWYCLLSAIRRSRTCGSRVPGSPICGLPSSRPLVISLNEFRSLLSRTTASGLTPSAVRNSFADLPIRCVSMTSWPSAETSVGLVSRCSLSDRIASADSSRSTDCRLIARSDWPTSVSAFCCATTMPALFSARSTSGSAASSASCTPDGAAATAAVAVLQAAHVARPAPRRCP